ncbi:class I SAM-dependent methyltransferase [Paenibacillus sp. UNC451MF]|uniref:class I SAM-dependent methyltransferase n=1 Tax=Paenibacillus sp. UNC451MF TaxID=1449063 RepID=UPI00048DEBA4|nr:class I SAM-dependent methyltransferase [Paenibacillus sp. UNC451MF]
MIPYSKKQLARSYDADAIRRSQSSIADWKAGERRYFVGRLREQGGKTILEIGAGTGRDSLYFKECGFEVTCIDLSEEMVRHCKEKGLNAEVMDFYQLDFADQSFDAVYALNCLLHVPKPELGQVFAEIRRVLKADGLFYMGVYGGRDSEGVWENDTCEPKRFFSFYTDEAVQVTVKTYFELDYFRVVPLQPDEPHFQSLLLINK